MLEWVIYAKILQYYTKNCIKMHYACKKNVILSKIFTKIKEQKQKRVCARKKNDQTLNKIPINFKSGHTLTFCE